LGPDRDQASPEHHAAHITDDEYDLQGCNTVYFGGNSLMLQRFILPPSSGLRCKPSKKQATKLAFL
jgi:hypothetical protein